VLEVQGDFIVGWWLVVSGEEVADGR